MIELIGRWSCSKCRAANALLIERGIEVRFRETREDPLTEGEIRDLLRRLGKPARQIVRRPDQDLAAAGLTGDEHDDVLVPWLVERPAAMQRPIAVLGEQAVIGRPPEAVLSLVST